MMKLLLPLLLSFAHGEEGACDEGACSTKVDALLQVRGDMARNAGPEEDAEPELAALLEDHLSLGREAEEAAAAALAVRDEELAWSSASGPCGKCQYCFVGGKCHEKAPDGTTGEAVCLKYGGTWCPTGKGPAPVKVDVPCISESDFTADTVLGSGCDLKGLAIGQGECKGGCVWSASKGKRGSKGTGYCKCPDETSCKGLSGTWKVKTCGSALQECGKHCAPFTKAKAAGSCDGLTIFGKPLDSTVGHFSRQCCKSAPKDLCHPNAELVTPCGQDADFLKDAEFKKGLSCGNLLSYWKPLDAAIKEAKAAKTCDKVKMRHFEHVVSHVAKRCCKHPLKTVCNPTGAVSDLSLCKNINDFKGKEMLKKGFSCADLSFHMKPYLKKAKAQGSCNLKTKWGKLSDLVGWAAPTCCKGPSLC